MTERPRIRRLREQKERHRQRSMVYRIGFGTAAVLVIIGGLLLSLPGIPGPGILLIILGLGMLALEFDRAERVLERILIRVEDATSGYSPLQKALLAVVGIGAVVGGFVAVLLWDIPVVPG